MSQTTHDKTAIDVGADRLLTCAEAGRLIGRHPCQIYRWMTRGLGGTVLESLILGRSRVTSVEALNRFGQHRRASRDQHRKARRRQHSANATARQGRAAHALRRARILPEE
jgi:hypothetical protein